MSVKTVVTSDGADRLYICGDLKDDIKSSFNGKWDRSRSSYKIPAYLRDPLLNSLKQLGICHEYVPSADILFNDGIKMFFSKGR